MAVIGRAGHVAKQQQALSELRKAPAAAVAAADDAACKKETAGQADGDRVTDGQSCSAHVPNYCPEHGSSYPTVIKGVTHYALGILSSDSPCNVHSMPYDACLLPVVPMGYIPPMNWPGQHLCGIQLTGASSLLPGGVPAGRSTPTPEPPLAMHPAPHRRLDVTNCA